MKNNLTLLIATAALALGTATAKEDPKKPHHKKVGGFEAAAQRYHDSAKKAKAEGHEQKARILNRLAQIKMEAAKHEGGKFSWEEYHKLKGELAVCEKPKEIEGKPHNQSYGLQKSRFGAPNSVRAVKPGEKNVNRLAIRRPFDPNRQKGETEEKKPTNHTKPGHKQPGRTGMVKTEKPGHKKPDIRNTLELTEEQAKALHAARKEWHEFAKGIHRSKLAVEEKRARLREGFKRLDAKVREILNEQQYAKLRELRRKKAKPGQHNENAQKKANQSKHRKRIAEELGLTSEQKKKLYAVHQHAVKRIKGIIANKELSKEEKHKEIRGVHLTARNRRGEILTGEQKEKLKKIWAHIREQRQHQASKSGNTHGRPQPGKGQKPSGSDGHGKKPKPIIDPTPRPLPASANGEKAKVILYTAPGCGYCTKAANALTAQGVSFEKKDFSKDPKAYRELKSKAENWRGGVPVIEAHGKIIVGYNPSAIERLAK